MISRSLIAIILIFSIVGCNKHTPPNNYNNGYNYPTPDAEFYTNFSEDWDNWRMEIDDTLCVVQTAFSEDWDNWDFTYGNINGDIYTNFSKDWDNWRLFSNGNTIQINTNFSEDWDNWRIFDPSDGTIIYVRASFSENWDNWDVTVNGDHFADIQTAFSDDFDNWDVYGDLGLLSPQQRIAVLFVPLFAGAIHSQDIHLD